MLHAGLLGVGISQDLQKPHDVARITMLLGLVNGLLGEVVSQDIQRVSPLHDLLPLCWISMILKHSNLVAIEPADQAICVGLIAFIGTIKSVLKMLDGRLGTQGLVTSGARRRMSNSGRA